MMCEKFDLSQQMYMICMLLCLVMHGIYLWHVRKCPIFHRCYRGECRFHKYCPKYKEGLTQEETEELLRLLDEYHRKD